MTAPVQIQTPLTPEAVKNLHAGDEVRITGTIYTARDAAHKKLCQLLDEGAPPPFDIRDQIIFYTGPPPAPPGYPIGSCGPTTSYRMDRYTPRLLRLGLRGMIGKGRRGQPVIDAIVENTAVYFSAEGGCGALLARYILESELVAFPELGTEAIRRLKVENFPVSVFCDCGGNIYSPYL
ncbi:MAG: FumA C-terminus/TtdB family hydratase beta subunit [Oscillospiraceae bacterium]|nr:FumA C-terminus/TtdB family hydratase beta subunit [Oscillospiraceae bacterium]